MNIALVITRLFLLVILSIVLSGCLPGGNDDLDEQRDPNFLAGKAYLNTFNYRAAAEAFEKALESNPRSASAHFELGLLYEQKLAVENAPAIAIYHFDKYLQLRPNSEHAQIVKQKILACKREIAKPFTVEPGSQPYLREYERLKAENLQLKSQLELWHVYYSNLMAKGQAVVASPPQGSDTRNLASGSSSAQIPQPPPVQQAQQQYLKHTVQAGDTMAGIAKKYGVNLNSLLAANPGVDPRRIKIGQVINVPVKQGTQR